MNFRFRTFFLYCLKSNRVFLFRPHIFQNFFSTYHIFAMLFPFFANQTHYKFILNRIKLTFLDMVLYLQFKLILWNPALQKSFKNIWSFCVCCGIKSWSTFIKNNPINNIKILNFTFLFVTLIFNSDDVLSIVKFALLYFKFC